MILKEIQWFTPNAIEVGKAFEDVYKNYDKHKELAKRQGYRSRTEFSYDKMKELVDRLLSNHVPEFPKEVQLKLPKFNKIELPKLKKIE